jgi:hypothetical protein
VSRHANTGFARFRRPTGPNLIAHLRVPESIGPNRQFPFDFEAVGIIYRRLPDQLLERVRHLPDVTPDYEQIGN